MANYTFSFIGTGNMGGALARAAARTLPAGEILLSNRTPAKAEALAEELGCAAGSVQRAAREGRFIFLGVKPHAMGALLKEITPILNDRRDRFVLVSMAAGVTIGRILTMMGEDPIYAPRPVIRIMPNTPCAVGEGMILYDANHTVTAEELAQFTAALAGAGVLDRLEERLIDAGSAVAGCGPAFVCLFLEALADGGVACGLPRQKAMLYAAHTLKGTAALQLSTGQHPGEMKDAVCSPGGSTIAGVRELERGRLRSAVLEAVLAAEEKNRDLGK